MTKIVKSLLHHHENSEKEKNWRKLLKTVKKTDELGPKEWADLENVKTQASSLC